MAVVEHVRVQLGVVDSPEPVLSLVLLVMKVVSVAHLAGAIVLFAAQLDGDEVAAVSVVVADPPHVPAVGGLCDRAEGILREYHRVASAYRYPSALAAGRQRPAGHTGRYV